ncbi:MAG: protein translocase subunit SecD [Planctomycetaceae bacterium]|nr:protein translocase subunit SecD [Planctomycetaceae bacterium]
MNSVVLLLAQAQAATEAVETTTSNNGFNSLMLFFGALILIFFVPIFVGSVLSKVLNMPKHATPLGITLGVVITCALTLVFGKMQYGVDIRGGTILLYEIDKSEMAQPIDPSQPMVSSNRESIDIDSVAAAIGQRLNPGGQKELSIRGYGQNQIEIVVPNVDQFEIDEIKRLVSSAGTLQFRIVANSRDHADIIQAARQQSTSDNQSIRVSRDVRSSDNRVIGKWYTVGREKARADGVRPLRENVLADIARDSKTGAILQFPPLEGDYAVERWLASQNISEVDVLIALEKGGQAFPMVNGEDLSRAGTTVDKSGGPAVSFNMNVAGAQKLLALTASNQPDSGFKRRMAIIMDGLVLSAPSLNSPISNNGIIEGRFTREEVDFMASILKSGRLPAVLGKEPISQNQIGSMLGVDTINKGMFASVAALIATFIMVLGYYRFCGIIACIALALNTALAFAVMIAIRQPLTLPGLAGLVLSVGMAVDANVLVFERIREELAKGSNKRSAVRNGFDRAFTTIVDSNLTTLITAGVLYAVGTDQIRGFAVTLGIGILCSMFTAVYVAHLMFDIAERFNMLSLSMSDIVGWAKKAFLGNRDIDFMGARVACLSLSALLIVIGIVAVAARGKNILDVDLMGGTSVVFQLKDAMPENDIRELTRKIFDKDAENNPISSTLSAIQTQDATPGTVYRLDTSIASEDELKKRLVEGFSKDGGPKLVTFEVENMAAPPSEKTSDASENSSPRRQARFVSYQDPSPATPAPASPAPANTEPQPPAETPAAAPEQPAAPVAETPAAATPPAATPAPTTPAPATPAPAAQESPAAEVTTDAEVKTAPGATTPAETAAPAAPSAPAVTTKLDVSLKASSGKQSAKIDPKNLTQKLIDAAASAGLTIVDAQIGLVPKNPPAGWTRESTAGFDKWEVTLPLDSVQSEQVIAGFQKLLSSEPVFLSLSEVRPSVAGEMQGKAFGAVIISLFFITAYIWFRFQKIAFGLAAVVALIHDVLITLGIVALCHWMSGPLGFLLIEDFKINLAMIASFLTIIGYSLNDTIVVFDRIREVRGKSPKLTSAMINLSVNQTLARTLLTSATTIVSVLLLYIFGGEGIHGFAFSLFVGIIVGTYSSIYIAAPVLLWLVEKQETSTKAN